MRFLSAVALASAGLVSSVTANDALLMQRDVHVLAKRDGTPTGGEFSPSTTQGVGDSCADTFAPPHWAPGYTICAPPANGKNQLCYNPKIGETCCNSLWACPANSYCGTNGQCLPGVEQMQSSSSPTTTVSVNTTAYICPTAAATPSGAPLPYNSNGTNASPTGAPGYGSTPAPYPGAAAAIGVERSAVAVAAFLALVGALL